MTDVTQLIQLTRAGVPGARERLYEIIYSELRVIARSMRWVGRPGDTLQATVLVNETFLELERRFPPAPTSTPETRATFYHSVALAMRSILRDHWRSRMSQRGGGGAMVSPLEGVEVADSADDREGRDFFALDEALNRLERVHPRWYHVVLLRHFAGRTEKQTARMLELAESTVRNDWKLARAWLKSELSRGGT
ncbi:MAG: ECF-type sigma factor [Planctomycetota bacterium]|nr:ECF-type sigma factor [Planctomycetota bacterium]